MNDKLEKILCAAIWYKDLDYKLIKPEKLDFFRPVNVDRGIVFTGYRHPHCMYLMISLFGIRSVTPECGEYEQGFLTSHNRFVGREKAVLIAKLADQISESFTGQLYSEDLY